MGEEKNGAKGTVDNGTAQSIDVGTKNGTKNGNNNGQDDKAQNSGSSVIDTGLSTEQVNKMIAKEKENARVAAYKELGIDPGDKKAVDMVKALIDSQKTDDQKIAEKKLEEAAKAREAEDRILKAEIKAEAMVVGIKREFVDDMVTLVMSKMAADSSVKTLLSEYKKKYPTWFEDSTKDVGNVGKRGTGSAIKGQSGSKKSGDDNKGMGQRLAARRKVSVPKKSFWG